MVLPRLELCRIAQYKQQTKTDGQMQPLERKPENAGGGTATVGNSKRWKAVRKTAVIRNP